MWQKQTESFNAQLKSRDDFQARLLDRYSELERSTDTLAKQLTVFQTATETFIHRVADALQSLDQAQGDRAAILQTITEAQQHSINEMTVLRSEIQTMAKDNQKENQTTQELLQNLTDQLAELTAVLKSSRIDRVIEILENAHLDEFGKIPTSMNHLLNEIQAAVSRITPNTLPDKKEEDTKS
jgi:chromosome segregation ATPase